MHTHHCREASMEFGELDALGSQVPCRPVTAGDGIAEHHEHIMWVSPDEGSQLL